MTGIVKLTALEALAEAAYERMYDSAWPKDDYDDAAALFYQAIELARALGLTSEARRLAARKAEIGEVYNRQFRWTRR
jgi:hypothetical protein